jgi:triacylglycerol lipase
MITILRNQLGSIRSVYLRGNHITRRDDFGQFSEVVLLLHGFFQTRNIWEVMERRLRNNNYGVFSLNQGGLLWRFNTRSIEYQAQWLAEKLERICEKHKLDKIHIIGHSMGGLIAKKYIQEYSGEKRVKSLITLGTPHHGTPTALIGVLLMGGGILSRSPMQMLPRSRVVQSIHNENFPESVQLTSIFSKGDVVCPWWCSVLRPTQKEKHIRNIRITGVGHSELAHNSKVFHAIRTQLELF